MSRYFVRIDVMFSSSKQTAQDVKEHLEMVVGEAVCRKFFTDRIKRRKLTIPTVEVGVSEE